MRFFFLVVFLVYGGMHVYAFFRARAAFAFGMPAGVLLGSFMLLMTVAPLLIRLLERREYELTARAISSTAYLWMGFLFLFFCISLAVEVPNAVFRIGGFLTGRTLFISPKPWFLTASGLALAIGIFGYFSAFNITTERITVQTEKLPAGMNRLRIVQISDVHLGLIVRKERLEKIVQAVKAEQPDMLVSTGDLVDAQINHLTGLAEMIRSVPTPFGKFAITGNHEFYAGLDQALQFTEAAGFTVLRDKAVTEQAITIVGVDDPAALQLKIRKPVPEASLLLQQSPGKFTLLLKHRPAVDSESAGLFDLQLSGHTHKGQIFPFTYLVRRAYPFVAGTFLLPSQAVLRVSRGTGTWGPPIRFLSDPEVTVIDLIRKPA